MKELGPEIVWGKDVFTYFFFICAPLSFDSHAKRT